MKALLILNHSLDYRESFLRKLGAKIDLTVVAQPCAQDGLTPPDTRTNYRYQEIPSHRVMGLQWQDGLNKKIDFDYYDIICCNLNPRQPQWIIQFLKNRRLRKKWVWWGPIQGKKPVSMDPVIEKPCHFAGSGLLGLFRTHCQPVK